jgi:hypothetical protein
MERGDRRGTVALLMLGPFGGARCAARRPLAFCAVTGAAGPGGWVRLAAAVMGLAQVPNDQAWLARAYVAGFFVVLFFDEMPWADLLAEALTA